MFYSPIYYGVNPTLPPIVLNPYKSLIYRGFLIYGILDSPHTFTSHIALYGFGLIYGYRSGQS